MLPSRFDYLTYLIQGKGEPPSFIATSVFFTIKSAIWAARKGAGVNEELRQDSPAAAEKIRLACTNQLLATAQK